MRDIKACLSSNSDDWKTPSYLLNSILDLGYIDTFKYKSEFDEFLNNYYDKDLFINPPFSKLANVVEWIERQLLNKNHILLLIPSRTDTKYFSKLLKHRPFIHFIKGRLHFNDSKKVAPFPTMILEFNTRGLNFDLFPFYVNQSLEEFVNYLKEKSIKWKKEN